MVRRFDLNLITTFDALWRERNVTRAAERLNISQPAVSNALMRLREVFRDELFIRSSSGIQPTDRCAEIAIELELALNHVDRSMAPRQDFDPEVSERTFHIGAMEYFDHVYAPKLLPRMVSQAPNVDLKIQLLRSSDGLDKLDFGTLDFIFSVESAPPKRIDYTPAITDDFVIIHRIGHPIENTELDMETFASVPFATLAPRTTMTSEIDALLAEHGLVRRLPLATDTMSAIYGAIMETDMVAVTPRLLAQNYMQFDKFRIMEMPMKTTPVTFKLFWSRRSNTDPGAMWMKSLINDITEELKAEISS